MNLNGKTETQKSALVRLIGDLNAVDSTPRLAHVLRMSDRKIATNHRSRRSKLSGSRLARWARASSPRCSSILAALFWRCRGNLFKKLYDRVIDGFCRTDSSDAARAAHKYSSPFAQSRLCLRIYLYYTSTYCQRSTPFFADYV
ncbi:uncharacterized protein LOC108049229 [Drosophila rhopaloa]|uniref:Uncharacterized protein LOC108049229 n=1 Tax=Drosophila rhopaloa TaxID=1041015 RepID=A0A6P4F6B6_DRORH|nr:uncharacterized protein LOC108049229 [Drosophila rhopaloa]